MKLLDVNILVYAHRADAPGHEALRRWWEACAASAEPFGVADVVLSGFLRVVTHPRAFHSPTPLQLAIRFTHEVKACPNFVDVRPGPRHWKIFLELCESANARGNLVPDAFLAALAIESGCEWISTDRGFRRFPGLRWRHPLE